MITAAGRCLYQAGFVERGKMSEDKAPKESIKPKDLEQAIMDPNISKNEREWWAAEEIERLRDAIDAGIFWLKENADDKALIVLLQARDKE